MEAGALVPRGSARSFSPAAFTSPIPGAKEAAGTTGSACTGAALTRGAEVAELAALASVLRPATLAVLAVGDVLTPFAIAEVLAALATEALAGMLGCALRVCARISSAISSAGARTATTASTLTNQRRAGLGATGLTIAAVTGTASGVPLTSGLHAEDAFSGRGASRSVAGICAPGTCGTAYARGAQAGAATGADPRVVMATGAVRAAPAAPAVT